MCAQKSVLINEIVISDQEQGKIKMVDPNAETQYS